MNRSTFTEPLAFVLFGVPFHDMTFERAVAWCLDKARTGRPVRIATANLDFVMQAHRDPELHRILLDCDLVVADGQPLVTLSRWFGPALPERVTGSDLTPLLAGAARDRGMSTFLLGGGDGVADRAAAALRKRFPGLRVAGTHSPALAPVDRMDHAGISARLEAASPDFLFVAFGAPKQEKFIDRHFHDWRVPVAMGVGGTLDFLAGAQVRAPRLVQRLHLEWLWRLGTHPRRLAARYVGNFTFLFRMLGASLACRLGGNREARATFPPEGSLRLPRLAQRGEAARLLAQWRSRAEAGDLVVDLGGRGWLNSLELGVLLGLRRAARSKGHGVFLWEPSKALRRQLGLWGLSRFLPAAVEPAHRPGVIDAPLPVPAGKRERAA